MKWMVFLDSYISHRDPVVVSITPSKKLVAIIISFGSFWMVMSITNKYFLHFFIISICLISKLQNCGLVPVFLIVHGVNIVSNLKWVPPLKILCESIQRSNSPVLFIQFYPRSFQILFIFYQELVYFLVHFRLIVILVELILIFVIEK